MSAGPRATGILVLTGLAASLIVSALAFFVHNRLYSNDLRRTAAAESALERRLAAAFAPARTSEHRGSLDAAELALTQQPTLAGNVARAVFSGSELEEFEARRVRSPFEVPTRSSSLVSPSDVAASYALGAVTLAWNPGAMNRVRAATLERDRSDLKLGQRVYRGVDGGEVEQVATLPFGEVTWRDAQLPISGSQLTYQIWTVLMRSGPAGDMLVDAERSDPVTVSTPEHFTLTLLRETEGQAVFLIQVNLPDAVGDHQASVRPGDEVLAGGRSTGLTLKDLQATKQDALITQQRLLLTTDGSLVLDPDTHEPRTTQSQVLKPVTRLVATLAGRDGALRTLHVDLP